MATQVEEPQIDESHPFRVLIKFAVFLGLIYVAGRFLAEKKAEYSNMTESQAHDRFVEKMGPKVGDDTANEIADQVVPKLKDAGLLKPDPVEAAADDVKKAAKDAAKTVDKKVEAVGDDVKKATKDAKNLVDKAVEETTDKVSEAVDSVVKD